MDGLSDVEPSVDPEGIVARLLDAEINWPGPEYEEMGISIEVASY